MFLVLLSNSNMIFILAIFRCNTVSHKLRVLHHVH